MKGSTAKTSRPNEQSSRRLLLFLGVSAVIIIAYTALRPAACDSFVPETDSYSPDLKQSQLKYIEERFPEDFENKLRGDEQLIQIIHFVDFVVPTKEQVFLDIGAHLGRIAFHIYSLWGQQSERDAKARFAKLNLEYEEEPKRPGRDRVDPQVHAFEVNEEYFDALKTLSESELPPNKLIVNRVAVLDRVGEQTISIQDEGRRRATAGDGEFHATVPCTTVDTYLSEKNISKVALVKLDVEGFESLVIDGMESSLKNGAIKMLLMDYGHKWRNEYTGAAESFTLREVSAKLNRWHFDCFIVSKHRLLKVNADYWDDAYEFHERFKYVSVDVWCVKHDFVLRQRIIEIYNSPFHV